MEEEAGEEEEDAGEKPGGTDPKTRAPHNFVRKNNENRNWQNLTNPPNKNNMRRTKRNIDIRTEHLLAEFKSD